MTGFLRGSTYSPWLWYGGSVFLFFCLPYET